MEMKCRGPRSLIMSYSALHCMGAGVWSHEWLL